MGEYFHVTPCTNLPSIQEQGLNPSPTFWGDGEYVWVFDDREVAEKAAKGPCWSSYSGDAVITVKLDDPQDLTEDGCMCGRGDDGECHAFKLPRNIPAESIVEVEVIKHELKDVFDHTNYTDDYPVDDYSW